MLRKGIFLFLLFIPLYCLAEDKKPNSLTVTTPDFLESGIMASIYTCTDKDISPAFTWDHIPDKTKSFAFTVVDENSKEPFYHWIIYNIPAKTKSLEEGKSLPKGAIVGKNSFGKEKYNGPCPPLGQSHTYVFTLYALDTTLPNTNNMDGKKLESSMQGHIIAKSEFRGVYSRWFR